MCVCVCVYVSVCLCVCVCVCVYYTHVCMCDNVHALQVPDNIGVDHLSSGTLPVVLTTDIQRSLDMFTPWLHPNNRHPFIVVGPEGCGKE